MNIKAHIGKFLIDVTQEQGKYSPKKIGSAVSVVMVIIGASAMIGVFIGHTMLNKQPPDYSGLGTGLGLLGLGSGAGAMLHSKSTEVPS